MPVPAGSVLGISRSTSLLLERTSMLVLGRSSLLELTGILRAPVWAPPVDAPAGSHWVIPIGSVGPVGAGAGVVYIVQGIDASEINIAFPVPRDLRVLKMNMAATQAPNAGNSFAYVLRKGNIPGTVFSDAGLSVVVSDTEVEDSADGSITFLRGERLDVKLVKTGAVPKAWHVGSLEIELL